MATDFAEPGKKVYHLFPRILSTSKPWPLAFAVLARPIHGSCQKEFCLVPKPFKSNTTVFAMILKTLLSPRVTFSNRHLSLLSVAGFDPWQH